LTNRRSEAIRKRHLNDTELQEDRVHVVASNRGPGLSEPQPLTELEHTAPRNRYTLMKKKNLPHTGLTFDSYLLPTSKSRDTKTRTKIKILTG